MSERILLIDDDPDSRERLELALGAAGTQVRATADAEGALALAEATSFDVVFCDAASLGPDLLPGLRSSQPDIALILLGTGDTNDLATLALELGAAAYLPRPLGQAEIAFGLRSARERLGLRQENSRLRRDVDRVVGDRPIVATSEAMIELLETLERAAAFKSSVLLTGERGTGKEVLARAIHAQSPRRAGPFVAVACAAFPADEIEGALFGQATATDRTRHARRGLICDADGGTLYLDDVGELPLNLQAKLLRLLVDEEVLALGESKPRPVDTRIIAASARDLSAEVSEGRLREDLLYRLDVLRLDVPPLRERPRDVPLLFDHFLSRFRDALGKPVRGIDDAALAHLVAYAWPGNVRELENVVERAVMLAEGETIGVQDLPANVASPPSEKPGDDFALKRARRAAEASAIRRALRATGGNRTHAARRLQISHRALLYKLKEYEIRD